MRLSRLLLPVAVASVWLAAFGAPSASAGMKFANLTGAQEVPGPGDPNGSAAAMLTLRPASGQVCVAQRHSNIDAPIAMHIHRGAAGVAGPILVDLTPTLTGSACVTANMTQVRRIDRNPNGYYLNIHTGTFSNGAIRGQLDSSMVGSSMPTTAGPTRLFGRMDGAQERPGPGDADGRGSVSSTSSRAPARCASTSATRRSPTRSSSCTSTRVPRASVGQSSSTSRRP
jgi:hypothetical protein